MSHKRKATRAAGICACAIALAVHTAAAAPPRRIVSLDLCADQILIDLVPRDRIAAVTHLAADPAVSAAARDAEGLPAIRGTAEEVLALDPDLVIAGAYGVPATVSLLQRLGRRVLVIPLAYDLATTREVVRQMAAAVGEPERGADLIRRLDERLAQVARDQDPARPRPTAIVYQANSFAATEGGLLDVILRAAGFDNQARHAKLGAAGRLPLETLVASPPDVIILTSAPGSLPGVSGDVLRHPALQHLLKTHASVMLDSVAWMCGTPRLADTVEHLAEARRKLAPRF